MEHAGTHPNIIHIQAFAHDVSSLPSCMLSLTYYITNTLELFHKTRNNSCHWDIKKGEEITISYDNGGPSQSRREHLKEKFGFDCTCDLCSLPVKALKLSDDRQRQILLLNEAIGKFNPRYNDPRRRHC